MRIIGGWRSPSGRSVGGTTVLLLLLLAIMWRVIPRLPLRVTTVRDRTEDVGAYAATYLLPFLALTFDQWQVIVALFWKKINWPKPLLKRLEA
jgi:hypothetical protein